MLPEPGPRWNCRPKKKREWLGTGTTDLRLFDTSGG
jgi:hypothetical protein